MKLTALQIETLALVRDGKVSQRNQGHGAWRIVGANPSVVGRLTSLGFVRWTKAIGGDAELTDAGRDALPASGKGPDMAEHFNQLRPSEAERLAVLAEECGEVIQIVGKILRHGYDSHNPHNPDAGNNRSLLEKEIGDLSAAIDIMRWERDVREQGIHDAANQKLKRIGQWLHHQTHPAITASDAD